MAASGNETGYHYNMPEFCQDSLYLRNYSSYSVEELEDQFYTSFQGIVITVLYPLVATIGIFGNVAFLLAILCYERMKTLTNFYLANLAVADLLFTLFGVSCELLKYIFWRGWAYGSLLLTSYAQCFGVKLISYLTYLASNCFIILVGFERFLAVCYPLKSLVVRTTKRTRTLIMITWLVALSLAIIISFITVNPYQYCIIWPPGDIYKYMPNVISQCSQSKGLQNVFIYQVVFGSTFILAAVLSIYFYVKIRQQLQHRIVTRSNQQQNNLRSQRQVLRMLATNSIVFYLCLAPLHILQWVGIYCSYNGIDFDHKTPVVIAKLATFINSAANPYIYGFMNKDYRMIYHQMFTKCCKQASQQESQPRSQQRQADNIHLRVL